MGLRKPCERKRETRNEEMYWRRVRENSGDQDQCGHVLFELGYQKLELNLQAVN